MSAPHLPAAGLSSDLRPLDQLRASAGRDPRAAIKEAARQFEAVFMQELMKSLRATTLATGGGEGGEMATEMLDSQYATQLAGLPGGLGDMIARQLERQLGGQAPQAAAPPASAPAAVSRGSSSQEDFLRQHRDAAALAARETGLPQAFILAQAAHESAWGRHEIRLADGSPAHNLFGIKATGGWRGKVAEVWTTEYLNGEPRKQVARFRAYDSYEQAFLDYARLLRGSERYASVVREGSTPQAFAQGLQKAGYASDPAYADKLTRVINTTLRLQRATLA